MYHVAWLLSSLLSLLFLFFLFFFFFFSFPSSSFTQLLLLQ